MLAYTFLSLLSACLTMLLHSHYDHTKHQRDGQRVNRNAIHE